MSYGEGRIYDSGIHLWFQPRVLRTECANNAPEAEVDPTRHKRRRNRQAHNLHQKPILTPLILPTHNASHIAQYLQKAARRKRKRKRMITPRTPFPGDDRSGDV